MATQVDICNQALSFLGDAASVTSINPADGSPQAGHCARWYPIALRRLFEEHAWSWATARDSDLARLTGVESADLGGYAFAFSLPSECVRILGVTDPEHFEPKDYLAMRFDSGPVIATDEERPVLTYVRYIDNPAVFPGWFTDALVARLAAYLVGPLRRSDSSTNTASNLLSLYGRLLSEAKTADSQSGTRRRDRYVASQLRARRV